MLATAASRNNNNNDTKLDLSRTVRSCPDPVHRREDEKTFKEPLIVDRQQDPASRCTTRSRSLGGESTSSLSSPFASSRSARARASSHVCVCTARVYTLHTLRASCVHDALLTRVLYTVCVHYYYYHHHHHYQHYYHHAARKSSSLPTSWNPHDE